MASNQPLEQPDPAAPPPSSKTLSQYGHKTLTTASNLANLLPTNTVLMFQTLVPSFSNGGRCEVANIFLTATIILTCSAACFLSSFTDSFVGPDGKLYYGIATINGLYVFSDGHQRLDVEKNEVLIEELKKHRIKSIDFIHAVTTLVVFLVVAVSTSNVQDCFFHNPGPNAMALITNMPLGIGVLSSTLFTLFPTQRRGIGYGDMHPHSRSK